MYLKYMSDHLVSLFPSLDIVLAETAKGDCSRLLIATQIRWLVFRLHEVPEVRICYIRTTHWITTLEMVESIYRLYSKKKQTHISDLLSSEQKTGTVIEVYWTHKFYSNIPFPCSYYGWLVWLCACVCTRMPTRTCKWRSILYKCI
jgi:hypothetical protein